MIKKVKEDFILEANVIHNNYFDYSKVDYVNNKTKVEIGCKIHGYFFQTPSNHLNSKAGCIFCGNLNKNIHKKIDIGSFIERANKVHNNLYRYECVKDLENNRSKVTITCFVHGDFLQQVGNHLKGSGCPECAKEKIANGQIKTQEQYIKEATEKHKGLYSYEKTDYVKSRNKVTITCNIHGDFKQNASSHLKGHGCSKCNLESNYSRSSYIKKAKGRVCTFYTLRCWNEDEEFYKIGITMNTLEERYARVSEMPYNYEIISKIYGEAGTTWDMELEQKRKLKSLNYQPKIKFAGSKTECFTNYKLEDEK